MEKMPPKLQNTKFQKTVLKEKSLEMDEAVMMEKMPPKLQNIKFQKTELKEISLELDEIGRKIVHSAFLVHKALGPGLLEKVYETCFCHELVKAGLNVNKQVDIPIIYDGITFKEGLRLDVLIESKVICELKAVDTLNPIWEAQILSHLKLTGKRLGYLINFNVIKIGQGIKRFAK